MRGHRRDNAAGEKQRRSYGAPEIDGRIAQLKKEIKTERQRGDGQGPGHRDSSPRRPSSTMRIFSSAEYCLRVGRRMSLMTCSAGAFPVPDFAGVVLRFCLIFAPLKGYDEP